MKSKKTIGRIIGVVLPIFIFLIAGASFVIFKANSSRSDIQVIAALPAFELTTQDNQPFGTDQMKGKLNLVYFFFSSCQGPCPIITNNLVELSRQFGESDKIQFIGISVDPRTDTPEVLKAFADQYNLKSSNWKLLRGDIEKIEEISQKGFLLAADGLPMMHSTRVVLVDQNCNIRQYYDATDMASLNILKTNVRELIKEL